VIYLDPIAILPGDFNHDGTVDAADYIVWRKGFETGTYMQTDYDLWRAHFGRGAGSNSSIAAIPEPMSAALALLALACCSLWLRAGSCRSRSNRLARASVEAFTYFLGTRASESPQCRTHHDGCKGVRLFRSG
jgi:hypothetical protein